MATVGQTWQRVTRNDQLLLFVLAAVVGAAAGYGALAFRVLTGGFQLPAFGEASERMVARYATPTWSWPNRALLEARAVERGEA